MVFQAAPASDSVRIFLNYERNVKCNNFQLTLDKIVNPDVQERISDIVSSVRLEIFVSLSCTMCPELVTAAQRIAIANPNVSAEVLDLNRYPALRDRCNVMSVPCMVVGSEAVTFGKKNIRQIPDLIG